MISVGELQPDDRPIWEELFRAYIDFYEGTLPQGMYDRAWREFQENNRMHALGARLDGRLVGIAHFWYTPTPPHPMSATSKTCSLPPTHAAKAWPAP
jgi:hypothetical protein